MEESVADDAPTMAFDVDARDVLPGARAARAPAPPPFARAAPLPRPAAIPLFRAEPFRTQIRPPPISAPARGVPLAIWILAALLVSVVSFFFAPRVLVLTHLLGGH